jgi:hypothetical protein
MSINPVGLDRSARNSGCRRDVHSPVRTSTRRRRRSLFRLRFGVVIFLVAPMSNANQSRPVRPVMKIVSSHHRPEDLPSHRRPALEVGQAPLMRFLLPLQHIPAATRFVLPKAATPSRSSRFDVHSLQGPRHWLTCPLEQFVLAVFHSRMLIRVIASRVAHKRDRSRSSVRRCGVARCGGRRVGHPTVLDVPRDTAATANRFV